MLNFKYTNKTRAVICSALCLLYPFGVLAQSSSSEPLRFGWIGAMTGPGAKYGVYQAAQIALEEINAAGGINGRPLEIIFEDGKGEGKAAIDAANKLIYLDKVRYILGGNCSPETMPIAPIAEKNRIILFASLTSNPKLSSAGDYIFRVTPVSTRNADILSEFAYHRAGKRKLAILAAQTDYVGPIADRLEKRFSELGGSTVRENFISGETSFRTILTRIKAGKPDAVYVGTQEPDSAELIIKQMHELGMKMQIYGNESTGSIAATSSTPSLYDGLIFAQLAIDRESPKTREFIEKYRKKFKVSDIPYVITPEAYDTVKLLAEMVQQCGDDVEKVKACLYQVRNYQGASGPLSIDEHGDGLREHALMIIKHGKPVRID